MGEKEAIKQEVSGTQQVPLTVLLNALLVKGYKNYGEQSSYTGILLQREYKGCFFNFYLYPKGKVMPVDMASAEICFECSDDGQWCKHQLYGVSVDVLANQIDATEEKLFAVFVKYEGHRYI